MKLSTLAFATLIACTTSLANGNDQPEHELCFDFSKNSWVYRHNGEDKPKLPRSFPANSVIHYRVININPFLHRVKGSNDHTAFKSSEIPENFAALIKGTFAEAAAKEPANAPTGERVTAAMPDITAGFRIPLSSHNLNVASTSNLMEMNIVKVEKEDLISTFQKVLVAHFMELRNAVTEFDKNTTYSGTAASQFEDIKNEVTSLATDVGALQLSYGTDYKAILVRTWESVLAKRRALEAADFKSEFDTVKEKLTQSKTKASEFSSSVNTLGNQTRLGRRLAIAIREQNLDAIVSAATESLAQSNLKEQKGNPFELQLSTNAELGVQSADLAIKFANGCSSSALSLSEHQGSKSLEMRGMERAIAEVSDQFMRLANRKDNALPLNPTLMLVLKSYADFCRSASHDRQESSQMAATLSQQAGALSKGLDAGLKEFKAAIPAGIKDVNSAEALYTTIKQTSDMSIRVPTPATIAKEGSVTFKMEVFDTSGPKEVDVFGDKDPEITYEVYDSSIRRFAFSVGYAVGSTEGRKYELRESGTGFVAAELPKDDFSLKSGLLMAHMLLNPGEDNSAALSVGIGEGSRLFVGGSYLLGRKQGLVFTVGTTFGSRDVLKFEPGHVFGSLNEEFTTRANRWGGVFVGLSIRTDNLIK